MFSKSLMKDFKCFGSGFTALHVEYNADTLLDFAINSRQNETRGRKSTRVTTIQVHRAVSHGRLMHSLVLRNCDLGLPSHLLPPRRLQQSGNFPTEPRKYAVLLYARVPKWIYFAPTGVRQNCILSKWRREFYSQRLHRWRGKITIIRQTPLNRW
jgi:hypothetical protein